MPTTNASQSIVHLLTPIKAMRLFCLGCRGGSCKDVRKCNRTRCPLWEYRLGCRPRGEAKHTPLRAIRAWWLWSMLGSAAEVRRSREIESPIWRYRFGKRPKLPSAVSDEIAPATGSRDGNSKTGAPFLAAATRSR
jgi:hypothetical protein